MVLEGRYHIKRFMTSLKWASKMLADNRIVLNGHIHFRGKHFMCAESNANCELPKHKKKSAVSKEENDFQS